MRVAWQLICLVFVPWSFAHSYTFDYQYSEDESPYTIHARLGYALVNESTSFLLDGEALSETDQCTDCGLFSNNVNLEAEARYFYNENLSFSASLGYILNEGTILTGTYTEIADDAKVELFPLAVGVQWHFAPYGAFRPYIGGGYHYTIISNKYDFVTMNDSASGLMLQAGFDLWFEENWGMNFDIKNYTMAIDVDYLDLTEVNLISENDINITTISAGVSHRF